MKRRTKILAIGIVTVLAVPSIVLARHGFRGGDVHDPWRMAKNVTEYTEQAKNAIQTSQIYANMALQLAKMAGVDVENSENKFVKAALKFSKYNGEVFNPKVWTEELPSQQHDYDKAHDYGTYAKMEADANSKRLEDLKEETSGTDIYQKAIDDITAIQGKSNLTEWQKANYAEAIDVIKKSQKISSMAKQMEYITKMDAIKHEKETAINAQSSRMLTTPKADPFIEEKAAPNGATVVDNVSYSSPTLGLTTF